MSVILGIAEIINGPAVGIIDGSFKQMMMDGLTFEAEKNINAHGSGKLVGNSPPMIELDKLIKRFDAIFTQKTSYASLNQSGQAEISEKLQHPERGIPLWISSDPPSP